jgi:hypothetical protein
VPSTIVSRYRDGYQLFLEIFLALKFAVFIYVIYSTFTFSSNYEQLLFRNVDDNAMITSITYMQEAIFTLDFSSFLFKYDYAYGWLFWMIYAVFSFPAFALTRVYPSIQVFESLHIVSNRIFSVILIFISIHLIKRIALLLLGSSRKNQLAAEILSFSVLLFPSVGYWAGRVQPSALTALLFVLTIFLLLSSWYETEPKKFTFYRFHLSGIDFSIIVFGCLIGVKPTTIPLTPIFLAVYFLVLSKKIRYKQGSHRMLVLRHTMLGFVAAALAASPSVLFMPVKTISKIYETIKFFSSNSVNQEIDVSQMLFRLNNGFLREGMGTLGFATLLILSIVLYFKSGLFPSGMRKTTLILVSAIPAVLFYSLIVDSNVSLISVYLFPIIVTQILLFPVLITQGAAKNSSTPMNISLIMLIVIGINFSDNLATPTNNRLAINSYVLDARSTEKQSLVSAQEKLLSAVGSKRPLTILQSYRSPTILSDLRSDVQTFYSFDNWGQFVGLDKVDYIVVNDNDVAMLSGDDQKLQLDSQKARLSELREGINIITRLIKINKFFEQKCEKVMYQTGNTLYECR